jgi:23S rRNA (guanosine2251-2'-O)-methyltransferase
MQNKEKIYGIHSLLEALEAGTSLNKVFIQKDVQNDRIKQLIHKLKQQEVPFQFVPREKLNRLTSRNHQGVIAITSEVDFLTVENLLPQLFEAGQPPLLAILAGITDVGNFGAVARSAECFGIDALVIPSQGAAMVTSDAMKASSGALAKVHICREMNFLRSVKYIRDSGLQLIAISEKSEKAIAEIDFGLPTALVLGAEGSGISEDLMALCDQGAGIPMSGDIGSLNVSVAAGIVFYEAMKGRA